MTMLSLHIGLPHCGAEHLQQVLFDKRRSLEKRGILFPLSAGRKNHTRLFMATSDPDRIEPFRWQRGHAEPKAQAALRDQVVEKLAAEIAQKTPDHIILSAWQLSTLPRLSELTRLRKMLTPLADDIRIVMHVDDPARLLARHYAYQIAAGRVEPLSTELALVSEGAWPTTEKEVIDPSLNAFPEVQSPPFWLDQARLVKAWSDVFGANSLRVRPYRGGAYSADAIGAELRTMFDLDIGFGDATPNEGTSAPSAETLARMRSVNAYLQAALAHGHHIPRPLRSRMFEHVATDGTPIDAASLAPVSSIFAASLAELSSRHPAFKDLLEKDGPNDPWSEPPFTNGFRATQYMSAFWPWITASSAEAPQIKRAPVKPPQSKSTHLPAAAKANFDRLKTGRFAPHNNVGKTDDAAPQPPFPNATFSPLKAGSSGTVIVGCMKNEGPYILEWVAYHRAIGVDNFLIYTNDCTDGTDAILDRLQEMGVLQHRDNSEWRGKSPQQFALNQSLKEQIIRKADWIAHIDVDEFINIRTGNGTLPEALERMPEATNIAMTWRLFGHNGVTEFVDEPVLAQFDHAAPKYCPKPHTVWGFKTLFKNIGAYEKISCHRPNKLRDSHRDKIQWYNGSGHPMRTDVRDKGWRSDIKSLGYDLIQLNHYALRSAESFLIKRQRGRALHVDRSVGSNYWVRMDWSDHQDVTIQRNLPRMLEERDRLLSDPQLSRLHSDAVAWHRAKASELRAMPEFSELYDQVMEMKFTPMERVAYALMLDMED